jgi:hypothetical protein
MPQGVGVDLSHILLKAMDLATTIKKLEKDIGALHNEIQLLIITKAEAEEIKLEDPDG